MSLANHLGVLSSGGVTLATVTSTVNSAVAASVVYKVVTATATNLNTTGAVASWTGLASAIVVDNLEILGWSATPSALLALTLRDAATGGGNSLVGLVASLNTPITSTALVASASPIASVLGAVRRVTSGALYLNVSAGNGTALTANIRVTYHEVA